MACSPAHQSHHIPLDQTAMEAWRRCEAGTRARCTVGCQHHWHRAAETENQLPRFPRHAPSPMTSQTDTTEITYHAASRVVNNRLTASSFDHTVDPRARKEAESQVQDITTSSLIFGQKTLYGVDCVYYGLTFFSVTFSILCIVEVTAVEIYSCTIYSHSPYVIGLTRVCYTNSTSLRPVRWGRGLA